MYTTIGRIAVPTLLALGLGAVGFAGDAPAPRASVAPSLEGTYRLVSRQMPDGTVLKPPAILGLWTYTRTHRHLHMLRQDTTGTFASFSLASTYTLTGTEYRETVLFSIRTDQSRGRDTVYDLPGRPRRAPVVADGGRLQFTLPVDGHALIFQGTQVTAIAANNAHVDTWEKVE